MLRNNGSRGKARSLRPRRRRFPQTEVPAAPRKKCVGKARCRGLPERAQINRNSHFIFRTENGGGQRSSSPVSVIAAKKDGRGFLQFFRKGARSERLFSGTPFDLIFGRTVQTRATNPNKKAPAGGAFLFGATGRTCKERRRPRRNSDRSPKARSRHVISAVRAVAKAKAPNKFRGLAWSYWPDLNRRPADYESAALPTEPQ